MAKTIVEHEMFGPVLFDTSTQQFETISRNKPVHNNVNKLQIFDYKNKQAFYFDSYKDFLESGMNIGIVPVVCVESKQHKRRYFVELLDENNYNFKFFNVEMIDSKWTNNKVANINKKKCYFALLINDNRALNDCLLLSTLEIKKGMN